MKYNWDCTIQGKELHIGKLKFKFKWSSAHNQYMLSTDSDCLIACRKFFGNFHLNWEAAIKEAEGYIDGWLKEITEICESITNEVKNVGK